MSWLKRVIRSFLPRDRYHEQANEINNRGLRSEILTKRLQVIERRGTQR